MRYRIREGDIIYELIEPAKEKDKKKGVLVFSGLPSQPRNDDFGDNLSAEGFWVLQPRYIGSWESYGKFSIKNCIRTVIESEKLFLKGKGTECWDGKEIIWNLNEIYLLSSSFGSAIVLSALPKLKSKNIICLCPLTNLNKHGTDKQIEEQDLNKLGEFIKKGFENAFRKFDLNDWKNFTSGNSKANPIIYASKIKNKKVLLIHGEKDNVVNISRTEEYYKMIKDKNEVEFKKYAHVGHGKQIKDASFDYILEWLRK